MSTNWRNNWRISNIYLMWSSMKEVLSKLLERAALTASSSYWLKRRSRLEYWRRCHHERWWAATRRRWLIARVSELRCYLDVALTLFERYRHQTDVKTTLWNHWKRCVWSEIESYFTNRKIINFIYALYYFELIQIQNNKEQIEHNEFFVFGILWIIKK